MLLTKIKQPKSNQVKNALSSSSVQSADFPLLENLTFFLHAACLELSRERQARIEVESRCNELEIENEKFCPEALLWNRISQKYKLICFSENTYFCEYIPDGLTAKIVKIRMTSPIASMLCYSELSGYNIPFVQKIKANINFWRFSFNSNLSFFKKIKMVNFIYSLIGFPIGLSMFIYSEIYWGHFLYHQIAIALVHS